MSSDADPALASFLGARPEDFQFAREQFQEGMKFPALRVALRDRNVKAEQIDRITHDLAADFVQPLALAQMSPATIISRLTDRGMADIEAEAVFQSVLHKNDKRLFSRGLTEPKANRWIDLILHCFGIIRLRR